jgi:hypothetical protein
MIIYYIFIEFSQKFNLFIFMQVICNVHMYKVDKFYFISYLGCFFAAVNPMFRLSAFKLGLKSKKL